MCSSDLGLDYSHVIEPDFSPDKVLQTKQVTREIERLSDEIITLWKHRDQLAEQKFNGKKYVENHRQVYYDTDNILESQIQKFKVCKHCSGLNTITSSSDKGAKILGITIPRDACKECQKEGHSLFKDTNKSRFTHIYLQDRINDEYPSK